MCGICTRLSRMFREETNADLKTAAALTFGNMARGDARAERVCGMVGADLIAQLRRETESDVSCVALTHASLGCIKNLCVFAPNRRKLLDAGLLLRMRSERIAGTAVKSIAEMAAGVVRLLASSEGDGFIAGVTEADESAYAIVDDLIGAAGDTDHEGLRCESIRAILALLRHAESGIFSHSICWSGKCPPTFFSIFSCRRHTSETARPGPSAACAGAGE